MLALMETLADFGTVAVFNYDTFTTAIYKAWFGMFSLTAASQLASLLIVIVFAVIVVEQQFRSRMRYAETRQSARVNRIPLTGWRAWLIAGFASGTLFFAFLLPVTQLSIWAASVFARISTSVTWNFSGIRCCYPLSPPCSPVPSRCSWSTQHAATLIRLLAPQCASPRLVTLCPAPFWRLEFSSPSPGWITG